MKSCEVALWVEGERESCSKPKGHRGMHRLRIGGIQVEWSLRVRDSEAREGVPVRRGGSIGRKR